MVISASGHVFTTHCIVSGPVGAFVFQCSSFGPLLSLNCQFALLTMMMPMVVVLTCKFALQMMVMMVVVMMVVVMMMVVVAVQVCLAEDDAVPKDHGPLSRG